MKNVAAILFLSIAWISCYQSQEGCLDTYARNYSVVADNDCEDCCIYPALSVYIASRHKGRALRSGDTLVDRNGVQFRLLSMTYLMSEYKLKSRDSTILVRERTVLNDAREIVDDVTIIDAFRYNFPVGTIRFAGGIDSLELFAGVDTANQKSGFNSAHPIEVMKDTSKRESTYYSARARIAVGAQFQDTVDIYGAYDGAVKRIGLDTLIFRGESYTMPLMVDMDKAFSATDVKGDPYGALDSIIIEPRKN